MSNDTVQITEKFLLGDILKVAMQEIRLMPFGWGMLPETDQQKIIDRMQNKVTDAVRQAVKIIAADGRPHLVADVEQVTFKDGIKVVLTISKQASDRHELADATGTMVLVVLPHIDRHLGGDAPVADKDQPELIA